MNAFHESFSQNKYLTSHLGNAIWSAPFILVESLTMAMPMISLFRNIHASIAKHFYATKLIRSAISWHRHRRTGPLTWQNAKRACVVDIKYRLYANEWKYI